MKPADELEQLFQRAGQCALSAMQKEGKLLPLLLVATPNGELRYTVSSLSDEKEKTVFANTCRLICAAFQASAVVLATEAWLKMAEPGDEEALKAPASEWSDRIEVVMLMGEAVGVRTQQKWLPIVRSDRGDFFGFGETECPPNMTFQGRFSQFLPPKAPSPTDRICTVAVLEVMGISLASLCQGLDRN